MKPPMHDPVALMQPVIIDGKVQKDGQGIVQMAQTNLFARVTEESTYVTDVRGETVQASHTICFPNTVTPSIGDEVTFGPFTVKIIKVDARKSFSGTKIFYWVTSCGI